MPPLVRSLLAVLAGVVASVAVVVAGDALAGQVYAVPAGTGPAEMREAIRAMPAGAFALLLAGWVAASAVGAFLAARLARRQPVAHGLVVAFVLLASTVANLWLLPHPAWVWAGALVGIPLAGWAASRTVRETPADLLAYRR